MRCAFLLCLLLCLRLSAPTDAAPYVLSPDDQLQISVLGHDDLAEAVTILPDGTFRYPVIGSVHAAGLTVAALTRALTRGLSEEFNQPQVTVSVVQTRLRRISVLGAVKAPGMYPVTVGMHLLDVLAACGGPAQSPQLTQATLVLDGGRRSLTLDIAGLLAGTDPAQNLPLDPGDVLLVQARDPSFAQAQALGEVVKPGAFDVPAGGLPIAAVLALVGGATPQAALTHAQILHDGQSEMLNLRPLLQNVADAVGQTRLMPGDVLLIPANTDRIAVLGAVHTPAAYLVPDGDSLTVTDALALAGGASSDADSKNAGILRRSDDGTPTALPLNLEALLRGDPHVLDVTLQPGDILYVPTQHEGKHFDAANLLSLVPLVNVLYR